MRDIYHKIGEKILKSPLNEVVFCICLHLGKERTDASAHMHRHGMSRMPFERRIL